MSLSVEIYYSCLLSTLNWLLSDFSLRAKTLACRRSEYLTVADMGIVDAWQYITAIVQPQHLTVCKRFLPTELDIVELPFNN